MRIVKVLIVSLFCIAVQANTPLLKVQPLAENLPPRPGGTRVTPNLLVSLPNRDERATVQWLDADNILYGIPQNKSEIGIVNLVNKNAKKLDIGTMPKASTDGKHIAYIKNLPSGKQLYLVDSDGSNAIQVTQFKGGLTGGAGYHYDYAWSPDSKKIAIFYQPMVDFWQRRSEKVPSSKSSAVMEDAVMSAPKPTSLLLFDLTKNKLVNITTIAANIRYPSWFSNNQKLLFLKEREALSYHQREDDTVIADYDVASKRLDNIAKIPGLQQMLSPTLSPDDKIVAYLYDGKNPLFAATSNLWLLPLDKKYQKGSLSTPATSELKLFDIKWQTNNKVVYALRYYGPYHQLYAININTQQVQQITHNPLSVESYSISADGKKLVWIGLDAHGNRIIRTADSTGANVHDIKVFASAPNNMALSEVREVEWKTSDYPYPIRGLIVMPLNYQAGKKYPLITDIHGGGLGAYLGLDAGFWVSSPLEWQLWAAKGYMVFVPDMRSSGSYGSLAITKNEYEEHDMINKDTLDVVAGIDSLIAQEWVDPAKIAIIGHSAGGRRVNWLAVTSHRFTTLVSKEGWADEWYLAGITPIKRTTDAYGGLPVNVPQNYQKNSCLFHAKGANTPILFLMSSSEKGADRYGNVQWLYHAIKAQGITTQYVQYPDEGHVMERPANRIDALNRTIAWIDSYLMKEKK